MDLVEIRKKANSKKTRPAKKKPVAEEAFAPSQEQVSAEEVPVVEQFDNETGSALNTESGAEPESAIAPETVATAQQAAPAHDVESDPLDELFSFQIDGGFATEGDYLQTLTGEKEIADHDIQQWLTFSLANEEYALTIESVSEIIKPREVTDIPRVPDFIKGIISLRGIIVPVFDLSCRLNLGKSDLSATTRIIVCQEGERLAGFLVDRINQVVNVPLAKIEPPPTVLSGLDRDFVEGVGRVDGRMLILLHLSNVINAELND